MKTKILIISLFSMLLISCADTKIIEGTAYTPKGLFTMDEKDKNIKYNISMGNVIWSCIFSETLVVPVVLCGWYLWEPAYAMPVKN